LLDGVLYELSPEDCSTAIIADIHTDTNSACVLEVGTGALNIIWVACPTGNGRYFICAGPVLSFYEFKQPMNKRLTDEQWQKMVQDNKEPESDILKKP